MRFLNGCQQQQQVLLLLLLLNAATAAYALHSKPSQQQLYLGVEQLTPPQNSEPSSTAGVPLSLALLQQQQPPQNSEPSSTAGVPLSLALLQQQQVTTGLDDALLNMTDEKEKPSFFQHSEWMGIASRIKANKGDV
ncbi:hypothetical protein EPH_0018920 [Eimeria praecox]|uniref:Uncharacterized protein n=1 Tax=Eimeria praecox TaxID=51316 RepID=U6H419_9EIME|nr:hypothetical protein EPH_0018920 [Eimeria praecox]